jgi:hypothetical protein
MEYLFDDYKFMIISPVHIGAGEQVSAYSYNTYNNGDSTYIDIYNLQDTMRLISEAVPSALNILDMKPQQIKSRIDYSKAIPVYSKGRIDKQIVFDEVDDFIASIDEHYLPGSSIKGAMVSVFEAYLNSYDINLIKNNLSIGDVFFDEDKYEKEITKGKRFVFGRNDFSQKQDNYKVWIMSGTTNSIDIVYKTNDKRLPSKNELLKSLYLSADKYLEYQIDFFEKALEQPGCELENEINSVISNLRDIKSDNSPEEPFLILGKNTHLYSKNPKKLKVKKEFDYVYEYGKYKKADDEPISRLLVDLIHFNKEKFNYTLPGFVWMIKDEN